MKQKLFKTIKIQSVSQRNRNNYKICLSNNVKGKIYINMNIYTVMNINISMDNKKFALFFCSAAGKLNNVTNKHFKLQNFPSQIVPRILIEHNFLLIAGNGATFFTRYNLKTKHFHTYVYINFFLTFIMI